MVIFAPLIFVLITAVSAQDCQSNADCSSITNTSCCYYPSALTQGLYTTFSCETAYGASLASLTCMNASDTVASTVCKGLFICTVNNISICTTQAGYVGHFKFLPLEPSTILSASIATAYLQDLTL